MAREDTARDAVAVNLASDTTYTTNPTFGLFVGTAGNVKVDMRGEGVGVVFAAVAGTTLPIQAAKVYSAANGTTASNIVALF